MNRGSSVEHLGLASLLFVPGAMPERFAKALAAGAGATVIDLEDSVPAAGKGAARSAAIAAVAGDARFSVRINPVTAIEGLRDLVALADAGVTPATLLIPKVESPAEVAIVRAALPSTPLIPLIETPDGLARTAEIARAGAAAMMFGGGDLSAELGVALAWEPLAVARGQFLLGCAAAGAAAIDVPWIALDDPAGLEAEARHAKAIGFAAKAAIHPAQVAVIEAVMRPSSEEAEEAAAAIAAFEAAGGAAVRFRGRMLEEPVMRRYRRIMAQVDLGKVSEHA